MKQLQRSHKSPKVVQFTMIALVLFTIALALPCHAQQINTAINGASSQVKGIFSSVSNLILMIGGLVGLAGAIRVFIKWQNGEPDVQKHLVGWLGACVFLLLTSVVLKTFFGV